MKNKGFTLIELLAVIVILAIIALIAIPMISKIIDKTEDSAVLRSAELYIDGVNQSIMKANLNSKFRPKECVIQEDGNLICDGETELKIETTGTKPSSGILTIEDRRVKSFKEMILDIYELEMDDKGDIVVVSTLDEQNEEYLSAPNLHNNLIPIVYSNNVWKVVDPTQKWYNYEIQEWANAVVLKSGVTKNVGDTVNIATEVQGMFVWIPRYEYKIEGQYGKHSDGSEGTAELPGEIKVKFISKDSIKASKGYILHPAFKFGSTELSGIWVGKFETSALSSSACYTSPSANNCNNANIVPYIIPNMRTLRYQSVSNQFVTAQKYNTSLSDNRADAHMAKNSEWSSAAYLSQSKYGKYGNPNYSGIDKEVMVNNCWIDGSYTGIGANSIDEGFSSTISATVCKTNTYETAKGQAASTTGNITGIYDMSGGDSEFVMGSYNKTVGSSEFTTWPNAKYYDLYTTDNIETACNGGVCYGHGFSETLGWYKDDNAFFSGEYIWPYRGGAYSNRESAGVFALGRYFGGPNAFYTFRIVITES